MKNTNLYWTIIFVGVFEVNVRASHNQDQTNVTIAAISLSTPLQTASRNSSNLSNSSVGAVVGSNNHLIPSIPHRVSFVSSVEAQPRTNLQQQQENVASVISAPSPFSPIQGNLETRRSIRYQRNSTVSSDNSYNHGQNGTLRAEPNFYKEEGQHQRSSESSSSLSSVPSHLAVRATSNAASCAAAASSTTLQGSRFSQRGRESSLLQQKMFEFNKKLKTFRIEHEELFKKMEEHQTEFDDLTQDVRALKGSFSNRPLNEDFGSELVAMLVVIGHENPHLKVNPVVSVPPLRLDSQSSLNASCSHSTNVFSLRRHTDLAAQFNRQSSSLPQPSDQYKPLMLSSDFVEHTFDDTVTSTATAAVARSFRDNNNEDDDADDEDSDGSPLLTSNVIGDNCGGISQKLGQRPYTALPSKSSTSLSSQNLENISLHCPTASNDQYQDDVYDNL